MLPQVAPLIIPPSEERSLSNSARYVLGTSQHEHGLDGHVLENDDGPHENDRCGRDGRVHENDCDHAPVLGPL